MKTLILITILLSFGTGLFQTSWSAEANRPFAIHKLKEVGLEVWVPQRPEWVLSIDQRANDVKALLLNTPELYYPTTAIEVVFSPDVSVAEDELEQAAYAAIEQIRKSAGASGTPDLELKTVKYGDISAYSNVFEVNFEGADYSMEAVVGVFSTNQVVTLLVTTPKGQLDHVSVMKAKIFKKLSPL